MTNAPQRRLSDLVHFIGTAEGSSDVMEGSSKSAIDPQRHFTIAD